MCFCLWLRCVCFSVLSLIAIYCASYQRNISHSGKSHFITFSQCHRTSPSLITLSHDFYKTYNLLSKLNHWQLYQQLLLCTYSILPVVLWKQTNVLTYIRYLFDCILYNQGHYLESTVKMLTCPTSPVTSGPTSDLTLKKSQRQCFIQSRTDLLSVRNEV